MDETDFFAEIFFTSGTSILRRYPSNQLCNIRDRLKSSNADWFVEDDLMINKRQIEYVRFYIPGE